MTEILAFHVDDPEDHPGSLQHFAPTIAVSLELPPGKYVAHGRVKVSNRDGDPQHGSAEIRIRSSLTSADSIRAYLNELSEMFFPLQAVLDLQERDTIDLVVATYAGYHGNASLIAVTVDDLVPPL
jgi:hypothetical protein